MEKQISEFRMWFIISFQNPACTSSEVSIKAAYAGCTRFTGSLNPNAKSDRAAAHCRIGHFLWCNRVKI